MSVSHPTLVGLFRTMFVNLTVPRGILISIGAWRIMMIALMPPAGAGLFGMNLGIMAPVMTLVL